MDFGGEDSGGGATVVVSGSFDATVRVWDCRAQGGKAVQVLEGAGDSVTSVVVGGAEILAGSVDGKVRVWDLRMGLCFVDVVGRRWCFLFSFCVCFGQGDWRY